MEKYKVLDIFSYVAKEIMDLSRIEEIFHNGIENPDMKFEDFHIVNNEKFDITDELILLAVNELLEENKKVAYLVKHNVLIAIIGY